MFYSPYTPAGRQYDRNAWLLYHFYCTGNCDQVAFHGNGIRTFNHYDKKERQNIYFMVDTTVPSTTYGRSNTRNPSIMGYCVLNRIPAWAAQETLLLYVNPDYRRRGVALKIYDTIMKNGVILMSGYSHNAKSKSLWTKIVANDKYTTWAHDIVNLNRQAPIIADDNALVCELKLYEDIKKLRRRRRHDVRIIAFNRRYVR